jgi:hypothetical protein
MYTEEASVFRTAAMQILKQTGTMIDVERPVANLFSATEKRLLYFTDCTTSTGDEAGGWGWGVVH